MARGRLPSAVTEQPADDRQPLAECERPRGAAVTGVVDAHVMQSSLRTYGLPGPIDVGHVLARLIARNDPWTAGPPRQDIENATAASER